jgi:hypothetical protein
MVTNISEECAAIFSGKKRCAWEDGRGKEKDSA